LKSGDRYTAIPGDPQTAVRSFKRLYKAMIAFRNLHGRLPTGRVELSKPIAPGIQLTDNDFTNPDAKTAAYAASNPLGDVEPSYMSRYLHRRPNGEKKPAFPGKGERDLWFVSNHYMRMVVLNVGDHKSVTYYGKLVGLFSDGEIEVKPIDQLVGHRLGRNMMAIEFPDQTGIPKDSLPVNVMMQRMSDDMTQPSGAPAAK